MSTEIATRFDEKWCQRHRRSDADLRAMIESPLLLGQWKEERQIGGRDIGAAQSDTDFTAVVKPIIGLNLTNIALSIDQTYMHADHARMELSSGFAASSLRE